MFLENDNALLKDEIFFYLKHFHVSEPFLSNFNSTKVDHNLYSNLLKNNNYKGNYSLEMRYDNDKCLDNVVSAINYLRNYK
jgi:hypothetical protein